LTWSGRLGEQGARPDEVWAAQAMEEGLLTIKRTLEGTEPA
jgi:hypothetical protein